MCTHTPILFNQQVEPVYQSYSTIFPITGQYYRYIVWRLHKWYQLVIPYSL